MLLTSACLLCCDKIHGSRPLAVTLSKILPSVEKTKTSPTSFAMCSAIETSPFVSVYQHSKLTCSEFDYTVYSEYLCGGSAKSINNFVAKSFKNKYRSRVGSARVYIDRTAHFLVCFCLHRKVLPI